MSSAPNFELITEIQMLTRRDFVLTDQTLLNPFNANPLVDGEWLELVSGYTLSRGSGSGNVSVYPIFTEKGRFDTQALGKASTLFLGSFEASTLVCNTASVSVGDLLMVGDVTYQSLTRRGILKATGSGGTVEVGWCTKVGSGKIQFVHMMNLKR